MKDKVGKYNIKKGKPLPLGVSERNGEIQFAVSVPDVKECLLHLYDKRGKKPYGTVVMDEFFRTGSIFSVCIENLPYRQFEYLYEARGKHFLDPYACLINGREPFGGGWDPEKVRCGLDFEDYDWEEDKNPAIPYESSVLYQIHVRGFTKHASSGVSKRGTFLGLKEKIPYLKELGVTALLALPCYEFSERMERTVYGGEQKGIAGTREQQGDKINYWGYGGECNYFSPKRAWCASPDNPIRELKDLIKELHKNGIEFIMEFCFGAGTNKNLMIDCLRYWTIEYHVDGFKINDDVTDAVTAATDPVLSRVKLLTAYWDTGRIYGERYMPEYKNLADFNDGFMVDARRFLKSDESQVEGFIGRLTGNPAGSAVINYITKMNGFTLMDLVSYDVKHNEKNGEEGRDGTDYNYSWNCGAEGKTRRKAVLALRKKQIKNAAALVFLSQGSPMLLSGDEFGNSSGGNNNPYCQDNTDSWLNWNQLKTNEAIFRYIKELIAFRKKHPIFHMPQMLRMADYTSCGYPDISFHGTKAWYPDLTNYSRVLGVMLCGKYAKPEDAFFYIAFNMHWESHDFDLPKLPAGMKWELVLDTSREESFVKKTKETDRAVGKRHPVPPRTILVFTAQ